mmetsp:Transcript_33853/g.88357  ORF Transcript_33853/g.88357 Transcript_33853/m.88357 type:complete len:103 (+) Transcript_33853:2-310(+)
MQHKVDMRHLDRFFHRHGYVNVETFATARVRASAVWTDNLFVRRAEPAIYPPVVWPSPFQCGRDSAQHMSWWCVPWMPWLPGSSTWGECQEGNSTAVGVATK